MTRKPGRMLGLTVELGATAAVLGVIWLLTANSHSPYIISLPTILSTFRRVWLFQRFTSDVLPSVERLVIGYLAAVAVAGTRTTIGMSKWVRMFTRPVTTFLRSIPPPLMVPVAIALFQIGTGFKVFVIAFVCIWPIEMNTEDGYAGLHPTLLETSRAYGLGFWKRLFYVILPAVSPRIFAGMRISIAFAVLLLVVAEQLGSSNGIGWFVLYSQQGYDVPGMWAGIVMLAILGVVALAAVSLVERRVLRWHFNLRATAA